MEIIGKSPIPIPFLVLGKLALAGCWLFFLTKRLGLEMLYESPVTETVGAAAFIVGFVVVVVSLIHLGQSTAVGFPDRETELKTRGLYGFSRNPVYVGGLVMCTGACLYALHVVNLVLFAIAAAVHFQIVKKEEVFLEQRFGQKWLDYKQRVPRYLGRIKKP
jgi:protein-S-isoprenylcysteine O-methyltransferase Ste14